MGREEEIAYAREHGIPVKGGTEAPPYSIDDNLWGRSSEGGAGSRTSTQPRPRTTSSSSSPGPRRRPTSPRSSRSASRPGVPSPSTASGSGWSSCSSGVAEIGCRHGVGIVDHIEDRIVGLKVRDIYEVPAATIILAAHRGAREARLRRSTRTTSSRPSTGTGRYLCYAGLWQEPLRADLDAYMDSANEFVTGEITVRLFKGLASVVARNSPYALYDAVAGELRRVAAESSASRPAPGSSSSSRCRRGWPIGFAIGIGGNLEAMKLFYELVGRLVVAFVRRRFGKQLGVAGGVALVAAVVGGAVAAYLMASKDVEEG